MKNMQISLVDFRVWSGPGKALADGRVAYQLSDRGLAKTSELRKVLKALDSGEEVDLVDEEGRTQAHLEFAKDGYVATAAVS